MTNEKQSGGNADQSKKSGSGNFANDPQRASEAGKKGGEHSHGTGGSSQTSQSGSGRSQQGAVKSDDDDESSKSGKESGGSKKER